MCLIILLLRIRHQSFAVVRDMSSWDGTAGLWEGEYLAAP